MSAQSSCFFRSYTVTDLRDILPDDETEAHRVYRTMAYKRFLDARKRHFKANIVWGLLIMPLAAGIMPLGATHVTTPDKIIGFGFLALVGVAVFSMLYHRSLYKSEITKPLLQAELAKWEAVYDKNSQQLLSAQSKKTDFYLVYNRLEKQRLQSSTRLNQILTPTVVLGIFTGAAFSGGYNDLGYFLGALALALLIPGLYYLKQTFTENTYARVCAADNARLARLESHDAGERGCCY